MKINAEISNLKKVFPARQFSLHKSNNKVKTNGVGRRTEIGRKKNVMTDPIFQDTGPVKSPLKGAAVRALCITHYC